MTLKCTTKTLLALAAFTPLPALASTTNPTVATWQITKYDTVTASGLLETQQISATGNVTKVHTDGRGRTIEQVDALNNVSTARYDNNGNLLQTRDPNGVGQDCAYDQQNRKTSCTDTAGATRTTKYSVGGLVLNQQDAKNVWNAVDAIYDARGRIVQTGTRLAGDLTSYTYDANGNKLTVTDGEGKTTTYAYDNRNLKTAWTFPGQTSTIRGAAGYDTVQYQYDEAARLVAFLRQDGTEDDTAYNFNGTVASKTFKKADGTTESQDTFTYDASNRPLTATKGRYSNTVAFQYDAIGRKAQESLSVGGNTYPVAYAYDADNRTTQITYPDGKVATKTYTQRNQLATVSFDGQNIATGLTYDNGGREISRTLGNGASQTRTYNTDSLVSTMATTLPSGVDAASSLNYGYDANKNLTAETFVGGSTTAYSATMAQDAKDRLTQETRTSGAAQSWNLTKEGDWASVTTNSTTETRTHNDNHQVIGLSSTTNNPTYDAQGDLATDEQARTYSWDQEKNLVGIVGTGTNVGFAYDALGRRVSKTNNGNTTVFIGAGNQEIAEYANGVLTKEHVYGTYVDENLATKDSSNGWQYRVMDRRYSTTALLDSTGAVLERYVYDAYGKTTVLDGAGVVKSSAPMTEILWTGRRLDTETGVYYFRSRYFSTTLGRFISRDVDYLDGANLYEGYFSEWQEVDPDGAMVGPAPQTCATGACKCVSIEVQYVTPAGRLGIYIDMMNGHKKLGGKIRTIFKVQGDPTKCKYAQDETGKASIDSRTKAKMQPQADLIKGWPAQSANSGKFNLIDPVDGRIVKVGNDSVTYTDNMGADLKDSGATQDSPIVQVRVVLGAVQKCFNSDNVNPTEKGTPDVKANLLWSDKFVYGQAEYERP